MLEAVFVGVFVGVLVGVFDAVLVGVGVGGVPSIGGGGNGNVGTVPTFNAMNLGFLQNRPEQTPKAYVLAQDVSSAVEARDKVRDLARIN